MKNAVKIMLGLVPKKNALNSDFEFHFFFQLLCIAYIPEISERGKLSKWIFRRIHFDIALGRLKFLRLMCSSNFFSHYTSPHPNSTHPLFNFLPGA